LVFRALVSLAFGLWGAPSSLLVFGGAAFFAFGLWFIIIKQVQKKKPIFAQKNLTYD